MSIALSVENVTKKYRLGTLGSGTASEDIQRWFRRKILRRDPDTIHSPHFTGHNNIEGDILWALRDVNFSVDKGEIIGIIGKNGAGKSTLLKILSQITSPTSGLVRIRGRLASLLEVGTGFSGELTGRENIFLNGGILGMTPKQIRRRFDEIVDFAEIEDFVDTPVKRYSSGMFVRLAFSVAAHLEVEIMVVDEVLAVGDVGFQNKCLGKMSDVSSNGRTVLFVSHRMDHIKNLCTRGVVLDGGRKIFDGPVQEAIGCYYGLFDNLLGSPHRHRDASSRGRVFIESCHIENASGMPVNILMTADPLTFVLAIKNLTDKPVKNLKSSIFLYDENGTHLSDLGTWESGFSPFCVEERAILRITIPRLPLHKGRYHFSCVVRSATGAYEIDDMIDNAGEFSVDYGDFHRIGQSVGGLFSITHQCQIAEE